MRKSLNLMIWLTSVAIVCLWTWGLFWQGGGTMRELPGASIKLGVPTGRTVKQALEVATGAIISLGYQKEPPQASWQSYIKDNFRIAYDPEDEAQTELRVIYVYFYELDTSLFSEAGIEEYGTLSEKLLAYGLKPLGEDTADRANYRRVETPQMFNERQNSPAVEASRQKVLLFQLGILACYSIIVLWPGFSIALKHFNQLSIPYPQKRILFSVGTSLVLAPGLFLLPPFGPFLLVPLPLAILFALVTTTNELLIWTGVSFVVMLFIAFLISYLLRKTNATITS